MFFLLSYLVPGLCIAQTYVADYKVESNRGDSLVPIPTTILVTYKIKSNSEFIEVKATENRLSNRYRNEVVSRSHVIIDIKNKLAYFPDEKIMMRVESYTLAPVDSNLNGKCIINTLSNNHNVKVVSCLELPVISPGVLFDNLQGGITKIEGKDLNIQLVDKVRKSDENINFTHFFKDYPKDKIKDTLRFF